MRFILHRSQYLLYIDVVNGQPQLLMIKGRELGVFECFVSGVCPYGELSFLFELMVTTIVLSILGFPSPANLKKTIAQFFCIKLTVLVFDFYPILETIV